MVARYAPPPLRLEVQALEPVRDRLEARRRDGGPPLVGVAPAGLGVLGEAQNRRSRELGLFLDAVRLDERATRGCSLVAQAREPLRRRNDDRGAAKEVGTGLASRGGAEVDAVAQAERDRRTRRERRGAQEDRLPAIEVSERTERGPDHGQAPGRGLDHDQVVFRRGGRELLEVDPGRDDGVRAGEPRGSAVGDVLAGRHEPVDPSEQAVALILAGREAEPLRVDEGGDTRRPGLEEGHVGEPRDSRVESVDDVEVPVPQRCRDVRADTHGNPDGGARRDGNGTRDCDDSFQLARLERAATGEEVG